LPSQTAQRLTVLLPGCRLLLRIVCSCGRVDSAWCSLPAARRISQQGHCYRSIPSTSCDSAPMICVLVPMSEWHFKKPEIRLQSVQGAGIRKLVGLHFEILLLRRLKMRRDRVQRWAKSNQRPSRTKCLHSAEADVRPPGPGWTHSGHARRGRINFNPRLQELPPP